MKNKHIISILFGIGFIIGWNVFLIQRDAKLFEAYNQTQPIVQTK